jgi:hypothetical protein
MLERGLEEELLLSVEAAVIEEEAMIEEEDKAVVKAVLEAAKIIAYSYE